MNVMSASQILVIKHYDEMHYHHEKIVTIMQVNMVMMISLKI
jgi:hypothetical protein